MPLTEQTASQPEQIFANKKTMAGEPGLTPRQQQKKDALELAELVYKIFKESDSGVNILDGKQKDNQNE